MNEKTEKTPLEIARQRRKEKLERGEKIERLNSYEKWLRSPNEKSFRKLVNAKCWDCQDDPLAGSTIKSIRECTVRLICPLWNIRPYQVKEK